MGPRRMLWNARSAFYVAIATTLTLALLTQTRWLIPLILLELAGSCVWLWRERRAYWPDGVPRVPCRLLALVLVLPLTTFLADVVSVLLQHPHP